MIDILNSMGGYLMHDAPSGEKWVGEKTISTLEISPYLNGYMLTLSSEGEDIREFGINLPINFMSKKNGGGFSDNAENVRFEIAKKFSSREDCGISRYVWLRIGIYI